MRAGSSFTRYGWLLCLWVLLIPFQYGYHISVLNQLEQVLTCKRRDSEAPSGPTNLPLCIPMSDVTFSAVTAVFTLGGLLGSLSANVLMDRYGRKGAARASALFVALGTALMGVSASVSALGFGRWASQCVFFQTSLTLDIRFLIGVGSGVGICVGPIYIAEIAPSEISGTVGMLFMLP
jgi:MFS family permease